MCSVFETPVRVRKKKLYGKYEVGDNGVIYSGGLPLVAIDGIGVNLGGHRMKIAYLVARAFVPNSEGREWVRHKNGDVKDNRACNLEWCEQKEETRRGRKPDCRWCSCWNLEGEKIGMWRSASEAALAMGLPARSVRAACNGLQKTAGGLLWRWGA